MIKPLRFEGKFIVVTGAARGIGKEIARIALEDGGQVAMVGRNEEGLRRTQEAFGEIGTRAVICRMRRSEPRPDRGCYPGHHGAVWEDRHPHQ